MSRETVRIEDQQTLIGGRSIHRRTVDRSASMALPI